MNQNIWSLIGFAAVALIVVGGLAFLSQHYTLDNIKSKTVGDGQYGTARWATKREIQKTYRHVPFQPELWRKGEHLPRQQGLVLGSLGRKNHVTALVDCDDIHCLMIGASGVGKTAFFLYPNLEYACASGMSYLALDTKGDLARNYGAVASKYYGYQVSVIDLRNPTRSDGNNLLTLINRYMDLARGHPDNLTYKARAEKYTKILAKSIINPEGESSRGENAYFYESAESLLAAVILLLSEYLPPTEGEPEMRHIVSVFKLVQDLLAVDPRSRDQRNGFQILMDRLPENHRAYMLAGAALTASDQAMASVMSTVLSRLNSFLDTELEQVDSGGSMEYYSNLCSMLFQAATKSNYFKELHTYYFHNSIGSNLYTEPRLWYVDAVSTEWILENFDSSYKVIIVSDAAMNPNELHEKQFVWGTGTYMRSSYEWLLLFRKQYPYLIWLNPETIPEKASYWTQTQVELADIFQMFHLSANGLEAGMKCLLVRQ